MLSQQTSVIKRLPDHVINQIKAGEVIERPFNVIKELVENSLDAFATAIKIELLDGGKRLIQISDNGIGIKHDSIIVAVDRHTTSKIFSLEDLDSLKSFGFRGEALASVASISKFSIKSKTQEDPLGYEVIFDNGKIISEQQIPMVTGTTIAVKDIFYNVPARLKFLRSTASEFSLIQDFLNAMSIGNPHVAFQFFHNGRMVFNHKAAATKQERFQSILGIDAQDYGPVQFEHGNFQIFGFAILPENIRSSQNSIVTFVNGRFVKDKIVRAAVYDGYNGLLMKGITPSAFLFIDMPSHMLDINAHPSKTEVRFYDPILIQDLIARGVSDAIKTNVTKNLFISKNTTTDFSSIKHQSIKSDLYSKNVIMPSSIANNTPVHRSLFEITKNGGIFEHIKFLNQFAKCFLIFEHPNNNELWFVDQHAFHERILFEEIQAAHKTQKIAKQMFLNPVLIPTNSHISNAYKENMDLIKNFGFEVEILDDHIAIHSVPTFLNQKYLNEIINEISDKLINEKNLNLEGLYHHCFATMACHSAIRAGEELSEDFVRKLINRSNDVDFFAHCPHGRPVIRKFSQNDVARWFERI